MEGRARDRRGGERQGERQEGRWKAGREAGGEAGRKAGKGGREGVRTGGGAATTQLDFPAALASSSCAVASLPAHASECSLYSSWAT